MLELVVAIAEYVPMAASPGTDTTTRGLYCTAPDVHDIVNVVPDAMELGAIAVQTCCEKDGEDTVGPAVHVQVRPPPLMVTDVVPDASVVTATSAPAGVVDADVQLIVLLFVVLVAEHTSCGALSVADAARGIIKAGHNTTSETYSQRSRGQILMYISKPYGGYLITNAFTLGT
ncbi:MAG: hypothetical protein KatS3mg054_0097 [Chloroflexus sp.]|nr:MAG: hypothetical protein KatS3mg054_0097 [Chloroflexus sp.]